MEYNGNKQIFVHILQSKTVAEEENDAITLCILGRKNLAQSYF
jgi:hypothetical protein